MSGARVWNRSYEAPNYILKASLEPDGIQNPSICRTLSCPADISFQVLHQALQISFGWASTHLFQFTLKLPGSSYTSHWNPQTARFNHRPTGDLLEIVDDEQEEFDHGPDFPNTFAKSVKASKIKIGKVLGDERYRGTVLQYEYDFGDGWEHEIVVEGQEEATEAFICVAGEGHGAAEDVGGSTDWEELKGAYRAAVPTDHQRLLKHWYENKASNRDPQGLWDGRERVWDQVGINLALGRLRW